MLGGFYLLLFLSGCLSIGSGPLTNSISIPAGQLKVKHKLPKGFCLDRSANNSTGLRETLVVTNCIEVNNGDRLYFSRRPVDTIVNITFTQSRVPKKFQKKDIYRKLLIKSSSRNLLLHLAKRSWSTVKKSYKVNFSMWTFRWLVPQNEKSL